MFPVILTETLSVTILLWCSLTCSLTHSQICSLIYSLWHLLSIMISLTCSLWHDLSDMISLTWCLWHSNSPKHNEKVTRNNLSEYERILACIFYHQSAVHLPAHKLSALESIWLTSANERCFWNGGWCRINPTTEIWIWNLNGAAFLSILTVLFSHSYTSPSIFSMLAMSWQSLPGCVALVSGTTSLRLRMSLSFVFPR